MKNINEKELHELFCRLKKKEKIAYEELYEKYSSLVYKIAFSILKDKENAEDIMQNVFIKIANLSEEKLPTNYEASWLYSVTKNEAISYIRKNKEMISIEEVTQNREEDKIEEVIQKENYENLLSSLEQKEKQIISLKVEVGLTFKEISKLLNMPIGTIQWKYYKSLHSLKLLIGNLSLFIVTATLTITNLRNNKRKIANSIDENIEENENQTILEDTESKDSIQQNYRNEDTILNNYKENSKEFEQEETNEEIIQETIESNIENNIELTFTDIALIGVTSIFLCFTIFFTIIFTNYQQKTKKKASKK